MKKTMTENTFYKMIITLVLLAGVLGGIIVLSGEEVSSEHRKKVQAFEKLEANREMRRIIREEIRVKYDEIQRLAEEADKLNCIIDESKCFY
jgi:uncharacterized membrane protein YagU involved in acid resistance